MSTTDDTIAFCHSCGAAMDVSRVAPFSNVECPSCTKHTRVKREFGPYTLLRRHAIGGMSMVFVGHDNTLDREVALKILSEDYSSDEKRITAFEEEARITAAISHPHVVRVFKTGKAFGRFYIAMEMVTGGHLEHQIRERGALPEAESLRLAIEVAEGLSAAHSAGLIHRDIKPGNILLDSAGSAKIVDFGLALMTKGGVATPDELWATPFYVPPETIEGLEEDYRADVYAFGATFYHVLAGKPPCTEESMVTSQLREAKKNIVPLSMACPHLAMETCAVIECAMAYDPSARFSSYEELIDSLNTALMVVTTRDKNIRKGIIPAVRPPVATTMTAAERRRILKKAKQKKIISSVLLLLVCALAVVAVVVVTNQKVDPVINPDTTNAGDENPIVTDHSGVEIGNLYQKARKNQENGNYEEAHSAFVQLRDNPKVQEPTRSWCGFEAMLASFLDGRSEEARDDANTLAKHLTTKDISPGFRKRLEPWLAALQQLPPITKPLDTDNPDHDIIYQMTCMASACKNWEQGKIDEALPFFTIIEKIPSKNDNSLIGIYQKKAKNYLADAKKLEASQPYPLPNTAAACRTKITALDEVISSLESRGRAKFNVRAWQVQLERHAKQLEQVTLPPSTGGASTFISNLPRMLKLSVDYRFTEAADIAKKSSTANDKERDLRNSVIGLCEGAGRFLRELESDAKKAPLRVNIQAKDGRAFTSIIDAGEGMVTLSSGQNEASLPWPQIKPADMINLYREAIKRNPADPKIQQRHEHAICFQWLSGEKEAAQTAAAKLGESSPAFKKRWTDWMQALK
jgi:eukaryotic-like serine/threonine-protein kinase